MTRDELKQLGPVAFVNGQPSTPAANKLVELGFNVNSGMGWGQFLDSMPQQSQQPQADQTQSSQPQPDASISQAVQQTQQQTATAPADTMPQVAQPAATLPPPALTAGPIQSALGLPPTMELANKYRYNPPWRV